MESIAQALSTFCAVAWGPWLVPVLLGGGAYSFYLPSFALMAIPAMTPTLLKFEQDNTTAL